MKKLLLVLMIVSLLVTLGGLTAWAQEPTEEPMPVPTEEPTAEPTEEPTAEPTEEPTAEPTEEPTAEPTEEPTAEPTEEPTAEPTEEPTAEPTAEPTPTVYPAGVSPSEYPSGVTWNSPVYVQAMGTTGTANWAIKFYDMGDLSGGTGTERTCTTGCSGSLAARAGHTIDLSAISDSELPSGMYSAVIESSEPLAALVNEVATDLTYGMSYSTGGSNQGGTELFFPNIARNHGSAQWVVPFYIQNATSTDITDLTLEFYRLDNQALDETVGPVSVQAGRAIEVDPTLVSGLDYTAYAVVATAGQNIVGVANQITSIEHQDLSYTAFAGGATTLYFPNIVNYYASSEWMSPMVIQNLGDSTATVSVEYYYFGGGAAYTVPDYTIAPKTGAPERPWVRPIPTNTQYSVVVRSKDTGSGAQPIAAVVIQNSYVYDQAMAYVMGGGGVATTLYAPRIAKYEGSAQWYSPIVIQNAGSGTATVRISYYDYDGSSTATYTVPDFTIPAGGAEPHRPWLVSDANLPPNKAYSMVVESIGGGAPELFAIVNEVSTNLSSGDRSLSYEGIAP